MGKKSRRFRTQMKRSMSYKLHPEEKIVPSEAKKREQAMQQLEAERLKIVQPANNDIMEQEIRKFEDQYGFHERNDEEAIKNNLLKANQEELVDWGRWSM